MREEDCPEVSRVVCDSFRWAAEREGADEGEIGRYLTGRGSVTAIRDQFDEYQCLVACSGPTIVGMVAVKVNEVTKLYVDPPYHRRGIGTMLFSEAERLIARSRHKELVLGAAFGSSILFYEAMGMRAVGRKHDVLGTVEGANVMLMAKSLTDEQRGA